MQGFVKTSVALAIGIDKGRPPLVSVGIPTFNRPEGLRRTLRLICNQTYRNLEILVSDNASPRSETQKIVQGFAADRQAGRIFSSADQYWSSRELPRCAGKSVWRLFHVGSRRRRMGSGFYRNLSVPSEPFLLGHDEDSKQSLERNISRSWRDPLPQLSPDVPLFQNVENYFALMQPNLFYGLHPRTSILFTLERIYFDFYDCYVVLRIILESNFRTIDKALYSAGVDAPDYEIKYADPKAKRFKKILALFWRSSLALCLNAPVLVDSDPDS